MKEFFEAFGIEQKVLGKDKFIYKIRCNKCGFEKVYNLSSFYATFTCKECKHQNGTAIKEYPLITSDIVLNLATILNKDVFSKIECCCLFCGQSIEEITKNILDDCIDHQKDIYTQVRALFNGQR